MKKILIVTVYGSYNHGSFLQAKQLGAKLSIYGAVTYLNSRTREWNLFKTILKRSKMFINFTKNPIRIIRIVLFEMVEAFKIKKAWRSLPSTDDAQSYDFLVLGSDEIWNISRPECQHPIYWGEGINAYKFSYAPSINNATDDWFEDYPNYKKYLQRIDKISVRDSMSRVVLSNYITKDIQIVLDPTLLNDPEGEEYHFIKPYIAVYTFIGHISRKEQKSIIEYARHHGLTLIAAGQNVEWCDKCVHSRKGNPFFIFKNASYVITSTFHGTAFAINYNKQFISFSKGSAKVEELLAQFCLGDRLFTIGDTVEKMFSKTIDYAHTNSILNRLRKNSLDFIASNFK